MFHFLPIAIRYDGTAVDERPRLPGPRRADVLRRPRHDPPHVRRIRAQHPALRFNYLSTEQDRREWVDAIRVARDILGQPAFAEYDGGEISPGPSVETDEEILAWVAHDAETALHPSCTARMGTDAMSVVDPLTMGVHGVDGLRVVDASAMPYITNGNIYAPVMMLAEKAADLIAGDEPLPPEPIPFYRHDPAAATGGGQSPSCCPQSGEHDLDELIGHRLGRRPAGASSRASWAPMTMSATSSPSTSSRSPASAARRS